MDRSTEAFAPPCLFLCDRAAAFVTTVPQLAPSVPQGRLMAETLLDVRHLPKARAYDQLHDQVRSLLAGIDDPIAAMSTISCVLFQGFDLVWAGFYRVVQRDALLRVGPYQGTI